jgi:hypothetical protein
MGAAMADTPATVIAEWPVNSRERLRVSIEQYNRSWLFSARRWFAADDGSIQPTKRGLSIGLKHLPRIAEETARALAFAREHGLIETEASNDDEAEGQRS